MIISGSLGQNVVPHVQDIFQVDSIFSFCGSKTLPEQWDKEWPKIKGVFTKIALICETLKKAAAQCEDDAIIISIMTTSDDISKKNSDQLDCSFVYIQILKKILLSITFEQKHLQEYVEYHRQCIDRQ